MCHLCQQVGVVRLCAQEVAQGVGLRLCGCKHGCEHEGDEEGEEEFFHSVLGVEGLTGKFAKSLAIVTLI